jgi:hypothetical protein
MVALLRQNGVVEVVRVASCQSAGHFAIRISGADFKLAFLSNEKLALGSYDELVVLDARTGTEVKRWTGQQMEFGEMQLAPSGATMITHPLLGRHAPGLAFRDLGSDSRLQLPGTNDATRARYAQDGAVIVLYNDGNIRVVDATSGELRRTIADGPNASYDGTVAWSASLNVIAAVVSPLMINADTKRRVIAWVDHDEARTLATPSEEVRHVVVAAGGRVVMASLFDLWAWGQAMQKRLPPPPNRGAASASSSR